MMISERSLLAIAFVALTAGCSPTPEAPPPTGAAPPLSAQTEPTYAEEKAAESDPETAPEPILATDGDEEGGDADDADKAGPPLETDADPAV